ncbi:MAG: DUF1311 domain-containing protein [Hyphomicrobiales bacterium]|nr:DUF1311 domain-containing protein [Hyphomicrobiales bacterium]
MFTGISTRAAFRAWGVALVFAAGAGGASAQSFDCSKAASAAEIAICASADLRAQDNVLAGAYGRAQFFFREDQGKLDALKQTQRAWVAARDRNCAGDPARIESCLSAAYAARLSAIAEFAANAAAQPPAQAAPVVATAPGVVEPASVPADRDASARVTIPAPGRYAIRAESASGVAIQLVDMIAGPGAVAGAAGARDGRLDLLLDKGVYKLRATGAKGATGVARLKADAFRELAAPVALNADAPQSGDLGDLQQRSYWIDVDKSDPLAIEALGRAVQDLRLWRNGDELVDLTPDVATIETKPGRPMTRVRLEGKVEPGRYRVTAYGGESAVWPDGGVDKPFMIRRIAPLSLAAGLAEATIGAFGSLRFVAPPDMDAFRIETPQPVGLRLRATRGGASATAAIAKNSRDPFVNATLAANDRDPALVEISGLEGQAFRLRGLHQSNDQRIVGSGPTFVTVDVAGEGGDEIPATALLVRFDAAGKSRVLAADAPRIGSGQAWRGRFNLRGPSTLLFEMTTPGQVAISARGPDVRVGVEPVLGATPPRADGAAPSVWSLEAGVYRIRIVPANNAAGVLDLVFGQPGQVPDQVPAPASRSAISFGRLTLDKGATYEIIANSAPQLLVGVRAAASPVDLSRGSIALWQGLPAADAPVVAPQPARPQRQGAAPSPARPAVVRTQAKPVAPAPPPRPVAPLSSVSSGDIQLQVRTPPGGVVVVRDQRGADVPFSVSDDQPANNGHTFTITIPASSVARALGVAWRADVKPQPATQAASPQLETIAAGAPKFFDLAEGQRREFRIEAKDGGLYRVETLGRLETGLKIGTNFLPKIDEAANNGAGHNALVQTYLRAGSYRVAVSAKDSAGRAGLRAAPATMTTTGALGPNGSVRASLADGRGAIVPIEIARTGNYRLDLYALGRDLSARLEDAEGWPLTSPGPLTRLDRVLEAGAYRLVVPPVAVDARMVARLRPIVAAPAIEGHGPHPLAFGGDQKFQWREPAARDAARTPDVWTFDLAGEANVELSITEGMIGEIIRDQNESVAKFSKTRPFSGKLAAGVYRVEARAIGRDDRLDYTLALSSRELQPDAPQFVDLPAKIDFVIAEDRVVNLTTFGRADLKGVLKDANGAIVERIAGRANDWNIALARRLPAGRYTLALSAMTAEPSPADDSSVEDQPDDDSGDSSDRAADDRDAQAGEPQPDESGVEVRLALPKEVDVSELATDVSASGAGPRVSRYALPQAPSGALALVAARSAAEIVLSVETRDAAAAPWRVVGFDRGPAPLVAWPAANKGDWRASVWSIDGGSAPIAIVARALTAQPQQGAQIALAPPPTAASDKVEEKISIGLARTPAAALVDLAGAGDDLLAGSSEGRALAPVSAGPLAPQSERLWLLSRDAALRSVEAPALVWKGDKIALALGAGEEAVLPAPQPPAGKARVWRARSAFGEPGLDAGRGMAAAGSVALAIDAGKPLRLGNAGGADALRADLESIDVALAPVLPLAQEISVLAPPRSAQPVSLSDPGSTIELDLAPDTAAFSTAAQGFAAAAADAAVSRVATAGAREVWLVNLSDKPAPTRVALVPGKLDPLTAGRVMKRFFGAAGATIVPVDAAKGDVLRIEGATATYVARSGRVAHGGSLVVDGPGDLTLDYKPGLVAAWIERAGVSPWPKPEARALQLPASLKIDGPAQSFALVQQQPYVLTLRTSAPVAVALEQNGGRELKLYPSGADFRRFLAAGEARLTLYAANGDAMSGELQASASPVTPVGEGVGDAVALSPGASALFGFEVKRTSEIGVGLRAEPDRAEARLLDVEGKLVGEGLAQIVKLDPGRYFLEARIPVDAPATIVRPAVVGLSPPPAGPPQEEIAKYLAAAGLKTNAR